MSVFLTLGYIVNGSFRLPPQSQGQSLVLTFTTVSLSQTDFFFFFLAPAPTLCLSSLFGDATASRRWIGQEIRLLDFTEMAETRAENSQLTVPGSIEERGTV